MTEYSRILIEDYCMGNPKTPKTIFLWEMVKMSYDVGCEPTESQMIKLSKLIRAENNLKLKEALKDLDEFLRGY